MSRLVAAYAKSVREEKKLRPIELARQMGLWKNLVKGVSRIRQFEQSDGCTSEFFERIREVLGLDQERIRDLLAEDERLHQAWLDDPIAMELIVRYMPAFYVNRNVPAGFDREAALTWALDQSRKEPRFKMCLRLSRRERIWITDGGTSYQSDIVEGGAENLPSMKLAGHYLKFMPPPR